MTPTAEPSTATQRPRLDHLVLWVADPAASAVFYEDALAAQPLRLAEFTAGEAPFPSVRLNDETILDLMPHTMAPRTEVFPGARTGSGHPLNHFCVALTGAEFDALATRLERLGAPVSRTGRGSFGARGAATRSFYFGDPDGNVVEARHYDEEPGAGDSSGAAGA
ncbi:VOC family protein [Streptomyces sp. SID8014]|uniref:VOC family protein n=1 Tax=Streptomyces sp. SID8014 TaxID=2706097 RepID=UPI0013BBDE42|nr:VOC family protein [Streptomyces sp. SID8014]NEC12124.1 VOC family protein [Streptomyces sp. SID8014]